MKCKAKSLKGRPCQAHAVKGSQFCFIHDPASGAARAKARKRGGERRRIPHCGTAEGVPVHIRTLEDVLAVLDYALAEAMPLENSVQRGRLLVALSGAFVEAIKTGELESRLEAIESALKSREVSE